MKTTEYLDTLKRGLGFATDYQLAKHMGWSTARMSGYRHRRTFDDATAVQVALVLLMSPHKVLADMQAERAAEEPLRRIWAEVADQLERADLKAIAAPIVAIALVLGSLPGQGGAANASPAAQSPTLPLMSTLRRLLRRITQGSPFEHLAYSR